MKELVGFTNLPMEVKTQIDRCVDIWKKHMGKKLVGVYLHGSIALNAFCPDSGDIDLLIVVEDSLTVEEKLAIARDIIEIDGKPRPLEMSAITVADAGNWVFDGNCVFHYSDFWTERYLKRFEDASAEVYVVDNEFPDGDVTSYIRLIKQCGIVLYGEPIGEVFSDISDEDFWNAISADVDDYAFDNYDERYFASNILILGRILSFAVEREILSKYDAGMWMIDYVPEELKEIPKDAMRTWYDGEKSDFDKDKLEKLRQFLVEEIKRYW